ncbi:MAG: tRNA uridine-5-carboxymethylaminomethyl(34) synthesis GTPase MnmE [Clostridia bacterium]
MENNTIVAISTPLGSGGISIVRMSGNQALEIANKIFESKKGLNPSSFEARKLYVGHITTKNFKENALCVYFKNPDSYTGEDLIEFQCHGGAKITEGVLQECINNGASFAKNGEFSMRAFENGKMTLAETEGMIDMINATSDAEIRAGYELLDGKLSKMANSVQKQLTEMLADIEVSFDYPENDYEETTSKKSKKILIKINDSLQELIKSNETGRLIKNGIKVLILGKPNVGKSSLLNCLIGSDKAIVTSVAGTTRDIVEDSFQMHGIRVNIVDTAGIHDTDDLIEKIGIEKAKKLINSADIILFVIDMSDKYDDKDDLILKLIQNKNYICVKNKIDKKKYEKNFNNQIETCTNNNFNIEQLKEMIYNNVVKNNIEESSIIITNTRHLESIKETQKHLQHAIENIDSLTLDLISIDLKLAYESIGEITGNTASEAIIDAIFSKFCLGK